MTAVSSVAHNIENNNHQIMKTAFYISGVTPVNHGRCLREVIKTFPEGMPDVIKEIVFYTDDDDPEEEEVLCYIEGQSISGLKIDKLRNGDTRLFLGWNASPMDIHMCYEYLRALKRVQSWAVITYADSDGIMTNEVADLSDAAMDEAWRERVEKMASLLNLDEEVVRIHGMRYTYNLQPKKFVEKTAGMTVDEQVMKLYSDIMDMQWSDPPAPKTYMLRWNTAISNFKLKDFEECMRMFHEPGFSLSWSIWDWQDVRYGDRVYMLRVGEGKTGIVMAGEIISEPYVDEDWSGKGRVTHYVDIRLEQMMHPEAATILETEELERRFGNIEWRGGHSGTLLDTEDAYHLGKCYEKFLVDNRKQFYRTEEEPVAVSRGEIPSE